MRPKRRLLLISALMTSVLTFGTLGFHLVEGWSLFDSFYMSLITLSTVGYEEIYPLTEQGRLFASILILVGVTATFVAIGVLADFIVKLELADYFGRRRRLRMVGKLSNHYIVCGLGRVGRGVVQELLRSRVPVLAIDSNSERAHWADDHKLPTLIGDATQDDTLIQANIKSAKGLVAAIGSDAKNVYVTLSARVLNPHLLISARASSEEAEEKLRRAGASTVFTPYGFIGHRLAQSMLRPHVLSFLDIASAFKHSDVELEFEQIKVSESSYVANKNLQESGIRDRHGVVVLAVLGPNGDMQFNPSSTTVIQPGDILIAMGDRSNLRKMEKELET